MDRGIDYVSYKLGQAAGGGGGNPNTVSTVSGELSDLHLPHMFASAIAANAMTVFVTIDATSLGAGMLGPTPMTPTYGTSARLMMAKIFSDGVQQALDISYDNNGYMDTGYIYMNGQIYNASFFSNLPASCTVISHPLP